MRSSYFETFHYQLINLVSTNSLRYMRSSYFETCIQFLTYTILCQLDSLRYMRSSYFETYVVVSNICFIASIHSAICGVVISRHFMADFPPCFRRYSLRYMRSSYFETICLRYEAPHRCYSLRYMRSSYFETRYYSMWLCFHIIHSAICGVVISRHYHYSDHSCDDKFTPLYAE